MALTLRYRFTQIIPIEIILAGSVYDLPYSLLSRFFRKLVYPLRLYLNPEQPFAKVMRGKNRFFFGKYGFRTKRLLLEILDREFVWKLHAIRFGMHIIFTHAPE